MSQIDLFPGLFLHLFDLLDPKLKAWSTTMAQPVETTTILNAQPFRMLLELNTMMFCVDDLCFTGPLSSTNIDHSATVKNTIYLCVTLNFDLRDINFFSSQDGQKAMHMSPPCICTGGLKNEGRRSNRRARTHTQTHRTLPNVLSPPASRSIKIHCYPNNLKS